MPQDYPEPTAADEQAKADRDTAVAADEEKLAGDLRTEEAAHAVSQADEAKLAEDSADPSTSSSTPTGGSSSPVDTGSGASSAGTDTPSTRDDAASELPNDGLGAGTEPTTEGAQTPTATDSSGAINPGLPAPPDQPSEGTVGTPSAGTDDEPLQAVEPTPDPDQPVGAFEPDPTAATVSDPAPYDPSNGGGGSNTGTSGQATQGDGPDLSAENTGDPVTASDSNPASADS